MDLMTLLAKLTLDKDQYDEGLKEAEKDAQNLNITTPVIPKTDNTQFEAGVKEAEETGNWFSEVMTGVWTGVKDAIVGMGITTTIAGIIGYMKQGISLAAKNGDAISKGAKNLGITTRAYQEYEYALGKSGLAMKDLTTAMRKMDDLRAGRDLTEEQAMWLGELGVNAEKAASKEQLLSDVMSSLAKYEGSDKGAIINWLFGNNDKWDGYFSQTAEEIENIKKEANDLGLIMSDESVQNAADFADATEKLGDRLEAIKRSFGEGILPVITEAVNKLMMIVDFFTGSDERSSSEMFTDLDSRYEARIKEIDTTAKTAEVLAQKLADMGDTSEMTATDFAKWKGSAAALVEMIPTLSDVIDVENGTISASIDEIGELIKQYAELEKETEYQTIKAEKQNVIDQKKIKLTEEAGKATEKLAEAEAKRNEAIDAYNAVLEKYGAEGVGYDATMEDIQKAQNAVLNSLFGDEAAYAQAYQELLGARSPLTEALGAAQAAQTEVDKLTSDVTEGESAFNAWTASIEGTSDSISSTAQAAETDVNNVTTALNDIPRDVYTTIHVTTEEDGYPRAIGGTIPYDNFPALLHRGEKVLTATQVRRGEGSGGSIDYGQLEDRIAAAIRAGMADAQVTAVVTDRQVAKGANRFNGNEIDSGRFRP